MKIYKKNNQIFFDECGELEEVAKLQGYEILEAGPFLYEIGEAVFKNSIQLTSEDIKNEIKYWKIIENDIYDEKADINKISSKILQYKFIIPLQYRGGEKECAVFISINEDPIEKVCSWDEYPEFWEIMFNDLNVEELYFQLKEIYKLITERR